MVEFHQIDHAKIYVKDMDKVTAFYVKKLGFQVVGPSPEIRKEKRYVVLSKGKVGIDLQVPSSAENLPLREEPYLGFTHIAFKVSNVQKSYEELVERGVDFTIKPEFNPDSGRTLALFKDPEGNEIHLTD